MAAVLRIVIKKERVNNDESESVLNHSMLEQNVIHCRDRNERQPLDIDNNFSVTRQPSLLLHLWSVLPILLIAEGDIGLASIAILAALINFFLIQAKTKTVIRYLSSGFVGAIPFLLYFLVH
jgi:cell division protein FtsW (lipid II flippase)